MSRLITIIILLTALWSRAYCTETHKVVGRVVESDGTPVSGAVIKLKVGQGDDAKMVAYAISDAEGNFTLDITKAPDAKTAEVGLTGYQTRQISWGNDLNAGDIILEEQPIVLHEIIAKSPPVFIKKDTIIYDAQSFTRESDTNIEDLISHLPGMTVEANGIIKYHGKEINRFYIEGADMLQGRYALATRNIRPEDITSVSVYENHQPIQALKDIVSSDRAALNIKLKSSKMLRPFGSVKAGVGGSDRVEALGELATILISAKSQNLITAKANNTGQTYAGEMDNHYRSSPLGSPVENFFPRTPFGSPSISSDRYSLNSSILASVNHLSKLSNTKQISAYADWKKGLDNFKNDLSTSYQTPGQEELTISQKTNNRLNSQTFTSSLMYVDNSASTYIGNTLSAIGKFIRNSYNLKVPYEVSQDTKSNIFKVGDNLHLIFRSGKNSFELYSNTNVSNIPLGQITGRNLTQDTLIVAQSAKGLRVENSERTSFVRVLSSNIHIGSNLLFDFIYDDLHTTGMSGLEKKPLPVNNIGGFNASIKVSPYIKYFIKSRNNFDLLTFSLSGTLEQVYARYNDREEKKILRRTPFVPSINARIDFVPANRHRLSLSGSTARLTDTGINNFIIHPIYSSYRMWFIPGANMTGKIKTLSSTLSYGYSAPVKGVNLMGVIDYSHITSPFINSLNVTPDLSENSYIKSANKLSTLGFQARASKHFIGQFCAINGSISGNLSNSLTARQNIIFKVKNRNFSASAGCDWSFFNNIINTYTTAIFYIFQQTQIGFKNTSTTCDISERLSIVPIERLVISCSASWRTTQLADNSHKSDLFLDGKISYKFNKKWEMELSLRNLTNRKGYTVYNVSDGITTRNHVDLRPFQTLVSAIYNY